MSGKVVVVVTLLAALLASSASSAPEESNILRKLLVKKERMSETSNKQEPAPRTERRAHLSGDEREIMTKQIMQAISGMSWVGQRKFSGCVVAVVVSIRGSCYFLRFMF